MNDVFVVGALHLDVVVDAPRLPELDETLIGDSVAYRFGGKGGNQALFSARMGARVAMAGRVGDDSFARTIMSELDRSGVDRSQVLQVPGATGMSVAIVEAHGEYGAVVVSGVNRTIDHKQIDTRGSKVILLQNEVPEDVNLGVVHGASDVQVVLNAAPARTVAPELLKATDLLVVNRVEAARLTDAAAGDLDAPDAARELAALGPRAVVVTLGAQGAVLYDGKALERVPPPARVEGSAHGAGDAFVGAMAAELARGRDPMTAVRFAASSAAYFVRTPPESRRVDHAAGC